MKWNVIIVSSILAVYALSAARAGDAVPGLQDLIGVKGRDGEIQLNKRGYQWARTQKNDTNAYSYWRNGRNGGCIAVQTSDGRYASIVRAADDDCRARGSGRDDGKGLQTVCRVQNNGQATSFLCTVEDIFKDKHKVRTLLQFPDMTMELLWQADGELVVRTAGLADRQATCTVSGDEVRFELDSREYSYIQGRQSARAAVQALSH